MKILAFFAHPDDETMFLGGTFAYLAEQGAEINFLCATRGEGGELGDPPVCDREDLGDIREEELRRAVKRLGGTTIKFLGYQDPEVGPEGELYSFTDNMDGLVKNLQDEIKRIQPQVVITHGSGGEYGHPAHVQAHEGMMRALAQESTLNTVVYAPSWLSRDTGVFTPAPAILIDITPWKKIKTEAVNCHRSQHGLFLRHGASRAGRPVTIPEMVRPQEALCRIHHSLAENQKDPLGELLKKISIPGQTPGE